MKFYRTIARAFPTIGSANLTRRKCQWIVACITASLTVFPALSHDDDASRAMVEFLSPSPADFTSQWDVEVKLRLANIEDFYGMHIVGNGHDVTSAFRLGHCARNGCTVEATLSVGRELDQGWNYFLATVQTPDGAVDSARLRFFERAGVESSTNGTGPPYAVHTSMSPTLGIEVDYTPETGNGVYYYPGNRVCSPQVGSPLTMVVLNRSTLEFKSLKCFGTGNNASLVTFLGTLTEADLILASTEPGKALAKLNLSAIGGTDFTAANAPAAYSYSIIGYGKGSSGIASESYNTTAAAAWHGINGNLINISADNRPLFGFQSTDPVGFAVVPNGRSAAVTIGNPSTFPTGSRGTPPGQTIPSGFSSVTYTSPALVGSGGGIWILVLDRYTLGLVQSTTFSSTVANGSLNTAQATEIDNYLATLDSTKIVFITTLLGSDSTAPAIAAKFTQFNVNNQYLNALQRIQRMGVTPYAFDKAMGNQASLGLRTSAFSMIGVPEGFTASTPCALPNNSTQVCGRNGSQWFSSALDTQQHETGALEGILSRNRAYQYSPNNTHPFNAQALGNNPTANDLLANALSQAISAAPTVPWPLNDTVGHKNAYVAMSYELVTRDFYGEGHCLAELRYCQDIRFYYVGGEAARVANGAVPSAIPFPEAHVGFTTSDWNEVAAQLTLERSYLGNVLAYEEWVESMNRDSASNIALILTNAATGVAADLNKATGQPEADIKRSPMSISMDVLTIASGLASSLGVVYKPAGVVSGLLSSVNGILGLANDAKKTKREPDPYVNQLGDLISKSSQTAAEAADNFNTAVRVNTATFFNGVYSDWFKLQTVGLMTVNPDAEGWYRNTRSGLASGIAPLLTASARENFYLQISSQYFGYKLVSPVPAYDPRCLWIPTRYKTLDQLNRAMAGVAGLTYDKLASYSWIYRDGLPQYDSGQKYNRGDGNWIYLYVVLKKNTAATWPEPFGTILMGVPSGSDGKGNLNMNRDALYDSGVFPYLSGYNPLPPGPSCYN
jgi:hypothetical protein